MTRSSANSQDGSSSSVSQASSKHLSAREKRAESLRISALEMDTEELESSDTEEAHHEDSASAAASSTLTPGAVRVEGPGALFRNGDDDNDDDLDERDHESDTCSDRVTTAQSAAVSVGGQVSIVHAETIDEAEIMRQAEDQVVAQAAKAEVLSQTPWRTIAGCSVLLAILTAAAIAIGFGVTLSKNGAVSSTPVVLTSEDNLVTSVTLIEPKLLNFISASKFKVTHQNNEEEIVTEGYMTSFFIQPKLCAEHADTNACIVDKIYEHGCCAGPECPADTKCGEIIPDVNVCTASRSDCRSVSCVECEKGPSGEEMYTVTDFATTWNCLDSGRDYLEDGREYKWAITCGPVERGGSEESNIGIGEYMCLAFREGVGFDFNATYSAGFPCQWIQINECGCAPEDVYDFGVEPPDPSVGWTPCRTEEDCPFLCGDAGYEKAKDLCYAFGGIGPGSLWDGMFFDEDVNEVKAEIVLSDEKRSENTSRTTSGGTGNQCSRCHSSIAWLLAGVALAFTM